MYFFLFFNPENRGFFFIYAQNISFNTFFVLTLTHNKCKTISITHIRLLVNQTPKCINLGGRVLGKGLLFVLRYFVPFLFLGEVRT